ncbi:hypothetical protein Tco_1077529 [Tanacetum coccineum]
MVLTTSRWKGPTSKSSVVDDHDFKVKDNVEYSHSDSFLSTQKVKELMNDIFDTPSSPDCIQDVDVSVLMDVDQPSLVNNDLGDVHVDSVVKDGDESDVKTIVVPFQRKKKLSKACLTPNVVPPPTTEVKCKKRRHNSIKKKSKKVIKSVFGPDGNEIPREVGSKLPLYGNEWENFVRDNLNSSVRTLQFLKEADDTFYITGYNHDRIECQYYE